VNMFTDHYDVLVVDDDPSVRKVLAIALSKWGATVATACNGAEALKAAQEKTFHLVISDVKMPRMDGHELLQRLKAMSPDIDVLMVTAHGTIDAAVEAMREGAADYITKPFSVDEVFVRVEKILGNRRLRDENRELHSEIRQSFDVNRGWRLVGSNGSMQKVYDAVQAVAGNRSNVLIQGETGTGKELVARSIHYSGPRADKPFVTLNCGSVSTSLLASQLFGHVKGAFTGAVKDNPGFFVAANGGTIFLDEVTEMDVEVQVKLLRAIQEREVTPVGGTKPLPIDVRIVAATNRDLATAVEEGVLRQDLYYRLSVVVIQIPPLRERKDDIPALVDYFNGRMSAEYGIAPRTISAQAMQALTQHDWPGNVRELENVIERVFALGNGSSIEPAHLPSEILCSNTQPGAVDIALPTLQKSQAELVRRVLEEAGGNKSEAARNLGIDRKRLYRLIRKYGLENIGRLAPASGGEK
jgi:two-component system response regulator HydG